ncbi:MAG: metal-sensing transcriptional repressor [Clostridia bacterium]|nr:metal-sensing transcriptional repressor [Clostridia bacterium]
MDEQNCTSCQRMKLRDDAEVKRLLNRLSRIEGQIRGIRGMVEKNAYCPDILIQSAAASAALNSFSRELLDSHVRTCVAEDLRQGRDETVDELLDTLRRLMR